MVVASDVFEFIPLVGVGSYKFGEKIDDDVKSKEFELLYERSIINDGFLYSHKDGKIMVTLDDENIIMQVFCSSDLFYKGRNIIGMTIAEVSELFGRSPNEYGEPYELPDDSFQVLASFYPLGLTFGLLNNKNGRITTAIATPDDDDFSDDA